MSDSKDPSIARVVTKVRLGEQKPDADYWRSLPYQQRLAALEELRQSYQRWMQSAKLGFQRVYRIVKR